MHDTDRTRDVWEKCSPEVRAKYPRQALRVNKKYLNAVFKSEIGQSSSTYWQRKGETKKVKNGEEILLERLTEKMSTDEKKRYKKNPLSIYKIYIVVSQKGTVQHPGNIQLRHSDMPGAFSPNQALTKWLGCNFGPS